MTRLEKHKILIQYFMDMMGLGINSIPVEDYRNKLLSFTDEEFEDE